MTQTWTQEERNEGASVLAERGLASALAKNDDAWNYAIDLACERNHYAAIMLKLADNINGFYEDGIRPDEWLLQDWERRLRAALDRCGK